MSGKLTLIAVVLVAACSTGTLPPDAAIGRPDADRTPPDANLPAPDADPNAPDATPAPDADPSVPDATPTSGTAVLNEVVFHHSNNDNTREFVEIFGDPGTNFDTLWVLNIDGDRDITGTLNPGRIVQAFQVGTTDGSGFWTTAEMQNAFENGSQTFLLVSNFTGVANDDVDTDNDGTIDVTSWDQTLDSVGFDDASSSATDVFYLDGAGPTLVRPNGSPPAHGGAARKADGVDTDNGSDWLLTAYDGVANDGSEASITYGFSNN
jgi:hypothetical protein